MYIILSYKLNWKQKWLTIDYLLEWLYNNFNFQVKNMW